jgi:hypothetical protein
MHMIGVTDLGRHACGGKAGDHEGRPYGVGGNSVGDGKSDVSASQSLDDYSIV